MTIDFKTLAETMTVLNLNLRAPSGSTNTLLLRDADTKTLTVLNSFTISSGGALQVTNSSLLLPSGSLTVNGSLQLDSGTVTVNGGLETGRGGSGSITIHGGSLVVTQELNMGFGSADTATLVMNGGQLIVTNGPTFITGSGTAAIIVSNGLFAAKDVVMGTGGGGPRQGSLTVAGGSVTISGFMSAGHSVAIGGESPL